MGRHCAAFGCRTTTALGVKLFTFPKNYSQEWIRAAGHGNDWKPSKTSSLCSLHFPKSSILGNRLVRGSLPIPPKATVVFGEEVYEEETNDSLLDDGILIKADDIKCEIKEEMSVEESLPIKLETEEVHDDETNDSLLDDGILIKADDIKCEIKEEMSVDESLPTQRETDGVRLYSCDICGERFKERIVLMMHKDVNHPQSVSDKSVKRSHRDIFNKSESKEKMDVQSDTKPICQNSTQNQTVKRFICDLCKKEFSQNDGLDQHKNFCGKKVHDKSTLAMQTFTMQYGSNTFSCETCGESFSSNSILEAHERFHTGEKLCLLVKSKLTNHTRVKKSERFSASMHTEESEVDSLPVEVKVENNVEQEIKVENIKEDIKTEEYISTEPVVY